MATPMESPQTHPVWCVLYGMGIIGFLVLYGIFQETMVRYRIYVAIWGSALGHWISWISWIWKTGGSKLNHAVLVLMHDDEWLMMRIWEFAEHDSELNGSSNLMNHSKHVKASTNQQPITDYLTFPTCFVVPPLAAGGNHDSALQWRPGVGWCDDFGIILTNDQWDLSMGFAGILLGFIWFYYDLLGICGDWMGLNGMLMESINITICNSCCIFPRSDLEAHGFPKLH